MVKVRVRKKPYEQAKKLYLEIAEEVSKELLALASNYKSAHDNLSLFDRYYRLKEELFRRMRETDGVYKTAFAGAVWFLSSNYDSVVWRVPERKRELLTYLAEKVKNPETFDEFLRAESFGDEKSAVVIYERVPEIDDIIIDDEEEKMKELRENGVEGILCPECGTFEDFDSLSKTKNWTTRETFYGVICDRDGEILEVGDSKVVEVEHACGFYSEHYAIDDFFAVKVGENEYLLEGDYWEKEKFPVRARIEERDGKRVMVDSETGKAVHEFTEEPVETYTPEVISPEEGAREFFLNFAHEFTGDESGIERYFEILEAEGGLWKDEDTGEIGFAAAFLKAPAELLREKLREKGIRAEFDVITNVIDDTSTKYALFDTENGLLLESGYVNESEPPYDTPEKLARAMAERYEAYRERYEKQFDVDLPRLNPDEVEKAAREVYEEIKNEIGGPEI